MSITTKGKQQISKHVSAYAKNGARIGADVPFLALEAFVGSPPSDRPGDRAWRDALETIGDYPAHATIIDDAHGQALADYGDEAFLTGFYAGVASAKAGGR